MLQAVLRFLVFLGSATAAMPNDAFVDGIVNRWQGESDKSAAGNRNLERTDRTPGRGSHPLTP